MILIRVLAGPLHGTGRRGPAHLRAVSGQFTEDPLRVFRAMVAARYGLTIGDDVREYAQQMPITALAPSRVQRELCKLLDSARPSYGCSGGIQWE